MNIVDLLTLIACQKEQEAIDALASSCSAELALDVAASPVLLLAIQNNLPKLVQYLLSKNRYPALTHKLWYDEGILEDALRYTGQCGALEIYRFLEVQAKNMVCMAIFEQAFDDNNGVRTLVNAIEHGHITMVEYLLKRESAAHIPKEIWIDYAAVLLTQVCRNGQVLMLQRLLEQGNSLLPRWQGYFGQVFVVIHNVLLSEAATNGQVAMFKFLLSTAGLVTNEERSSLNSSANDLLVVAFNNNHLAMVEYLLSAEIQQVLPNFNFNWQTFPYVTVLLKALATGNNALIDSLNQLYPNVAPYLGPENLSPNLESQRIIPDNAVMRHLALRGRVDVMRIYFLLRKDKPLLQREFALDTSLLPALVAIGQVESLNYLLSHDVKQLGVDFSIDALAQNNNEALRTACRNKHIAMVKYLLQHNESGPLFPNVIAVLLQEPTAVLTELWHLGLLSTVQEVLVLVMQQSPLESRKTVCTELKKWLPLLTPYASPLTALANKWRQYIAQTDALEIAQNSQQQLAPLPMVIQYESHASQASIKPAASTVVAMQY